MPTEGAARQAAPEELAVPFALPETTLAGAPGPAEDRPLQVPYALPPEPPGAPAHTESTEEMLDVTALAGAPELDPAAPSAGEAILIDEKVGEINGRPVRVRDILDEIGSRLQATAKTKRLQPEEWELITGRYEPRAASRPLAREEWLAFAGALSALKINGMLRDELLEA